MAVLSEAGTSMCCGNEWMVVKYKYPEEVGVHINGYRVQEKCTRSK